MLRHDLHPPITYRLFNANAYPGATGSPSRCMGPKHPLEKGDKTVTLHFSISSNECTFGSLSSPLLIPTHVPKASACSNTTVSPLGISDESIASG